MDIKNLRVKFSQGDIVVELVGASIGKSECQSK